MQNASVRPNQEVLGDTHLFTILLGDIKQAVRDNAVHEYEHYRRYVCSGSEQFDLSTQEADKLLRALDILKLPDGEERRKLMLELMPELLSPQEHAQAKLEHEFRFANGRGHACTHLQADTRTQCAKCIKGVPAECGETCPARAQSPELTHLQPLAA